MPRAARRVEAGTIYHVLNRGNGRQWLFAGDADYRAFLAVLGQAQRRTPGLGLLAYCLMPNHWHLVVRPAAAGDLAAFMRWAGVTHVRRHHAHHRTTGGGHLYQGRFKSFPVQDDHHLLVLLRYVEANAVRAKLVRDARRWPWCSLTQRLRDGATPGATSSARAAASGHEDDPAVTLCDWPVDRPRNWVALVNAGLGEPDLAAVRTSVVRGRPYGSAAWVARTVKRLGLESTVRPRGRPPSNSKGKG